MESYLIANLQNMGKTDFEDYPKQVLVHMTQELIDLLQSKVVSSESFRKQSSDLEFIQYNLPEKFWDLFSWFTSEEFDEKVAEYEFDENYACVLAKNHPLVEEGMRIAKENPSEYMIYPYYRIYPLGGIAICAEIEDGNGYVELDIETRSGFFLT